MTVRAIFDRLGMTKAEWRLHQTRAQAEAGIAAAVERLREAA